MTKEDIKNEIIKSVERPFRPTNEQTDKLLKEMYRECLEIPENFDIEIKHEKGGVMVEVYLEGKCEFVYIDLGKIADLGGLK